MPKSSRSPISIIIPTYNGKKLLAKYLPSVLHIMSPADELIIIDDASSDASFEWLQAQFQLADDSFVTSEVTPIDRAARYMKAKQDQRVRVIFNTSNVRFGAAVNRAVRWAQHDLLLVINSDVKPFPGVIEALVPHFADPTMFAVGCHETETHHARQSAGKNTLRFAKGMFMHNRAEEFSTGETAWASGGSAMFSRRKWLELAGFDQLFYPAYWEDIDLSHRAKKHGWKVWFESDAHVEHNHETTNQDVFGQQRIAKMSWRNARLFTWRHATWSQKVAFILWTPYHFYHQWRSGQL